MTTERKPTTWEVIERIAKAWPIAGALLLLVGGYYTQGDRIDNIQTAQAALADVPGRVARLEDERVSDNEMSAQQITSLSTQLQSIQNTEADFGKGQIAVLQQLSTVEEDLKFLLNPSGIAPMPGKGNIR
jgi:hypothetical protein